MNMMSTNMSITESGLDADGVSERRDGGPADDDDDDEVDEGGTGDDVTLSADTVERFAVPSSSSSLYVSMKAAMKGVTTAV